MLPANPGMGFRPMPDIEKTLIKYNRQDDKEILPFRDNIKYFLTPNKTGKKSRFIVSKIIIMVQGVSRVLRYSKATYLCF